MHIESPYRLPPSPNNAPTGMRVHKLAKEHVYTAQGRMY